MPPIKIVPLGQIRRDPGIWPRKQLCKELVREFAELYRFHNPESIAPIVVAPAGPDGLNLLLDGWHRVAGAKEAGLVQLPAIIRPVDSDAEAYEIAVRLSSKGSLKMTPAEKRAAVDRLLATDPERSDRDIAEIVGVSHPLVARRREALGRPATEKVRSDGQIRPGRHAASLIQAAQALEAAVAYEIVCTSEGASGSEAGIARMAQFLARAAVKQAEQEAVPVLERGYRRSCWRRESDLTGVLPVETLPPRKRGRGETKRFRTRHRTTGAKAAETPPAGSPRWNRDGSRSPPGGGRRAAASAP